MLFGAEDGGVGGTPLCPLSGDGDNGRGFRRKGCGGGGAPSPGWWGCASHMNSVAECGGGGTPSPGRWGCASRGIAPAAAPSSPSSASLLPLSLSLCSPLHPCRDCSTIVSVGCRGGGGTSGINYGSVATLKHANMSFLLLESIN